MHMCRGQVVACGTPDDVFRRHELLDAAALRAPWVVTVGDALRAAGAVPVESELPRSAEAFLNVVGAKRQPGPREESND